MFEQSPNTPEAHVVYNIYVKDGTDCWFVTHRFNDFKLLHQELRSQFKNSLDVGDLPPDKTFFTTETTAVFLNKRRMLLEQYLQNLLRLPPVFHSSAARAFLEPPATSTAPTSGSTKRKKRADDLFLLPPPPAKLIVPLAVAVSEAPPLPPVIQPLPPKPDQATPTHTAVAVVDSGIDKEHEFVVVPENPRQSPPPVAKVEEPPQFAHPDPPKRRKAAKEFELEEIEPGAAKPKKAGPAKHKPAASTAASSKTPTKSRKEPSPSKSSTGSANGAEVPAEDETVFLISLLDGIKEKLEFLSILKATKEANSSNVLFLFLKCEGKFDATMRVLRQETASLKHLATVLLPPDQEQSALPSLDSLSASTLSSSTAGDDLRSSTSSIDPNSLTIPKQASPVNAIEPKPDNQVLLAVYLKACLLQIDSAINWATSFNEEMEKAKLTSTSKDARVEAIEKEAARLVLLLTDEEQQASQGLSALKIQEHMADLVHRVEVEIEANNRATSQASAATATAGLSDPLVLKLTNIKEFLLSNCPPAQPTKSEPMHWTTRE